MRPKLETAAQHDGRGRNINMTKINMTKISEPLTPAFIKQSGYWED